MYITEAEKRQLVDFIESYDFSRYMNYHEAMNAVAKATGLTRSAIFMYETEERIPRDENKVALAKYFGKTVQELFFLTWNVTIRDLCRLHK